LQRQALALYEQLIRDDVKFTNWYERMARRSTGTPADTVVTRPRNGGVELG
jgi:hypothetical protein